MNVLRTCHAPHLNILQDDQTAQIRGLAGEMGISITTRVKNYMFSSADSKFAGYCFLSYSLKGDIESLPSVPFGVSLPGIS